VNANTVLRAYRSLRTEGLLEFRRGRGVRVRREAVAGASVIEAARRLLELGHRHGYTTQDITQLVTSLSTKESS
jgi:GntR family transcriptional regulator